MEEFTNGILRCRKSSLFYMYCIAFVEKDTRLLMFLQYVNIIQIWYGVAAASIKTTILLLYLRVFSPRRWSPFDLIIRVFIMIICVFYFAISIAKLCQCLPRARIWDKSVPGTCLNLPALLDTSGLFNIISDTCILLVPLKGIWRLQMSRKRKIGVYAVFTVGTMQVLASDLGSYCLTISRNRAPVFSTVGFVMRFTLTSGMDQSYNQPLILLWALVSPTPYSLFQLVLMDFRTAELATGMMIICFPTLPGIFQRRSRKPTPSIVNGSSNRARNIRPYQRTTYADEDYHELVDGKYREVRIGKPAQAIINNIRGGSSGDDDTYSSSMLGLQTDANTMSDGIVKMTKIEQTGREK